MKKRITTIIVITLFVLLSGANAYSQTMDKIYPVIKPTSNSILFLNIETGELISVAVFDQPAYNVVFTEDGLFYVISTNYMYKGDLKSGDILDKYKHTDLIEKTVNDYFDPNMYIIPRGITPDGYALIDFNAKKLEATRNQKKYMDKLLKAEGNAVFDITAASEKNNKVLEKESKTLELYLIDFNKKSKTHYGSFNTNDVFVGGISQGEIISLYDVSKHEWTYKNVISGEVTKKISYSGFFAKHPELASLEMKDSYLPLPLANDIVKCRFNDTINKKYVKITFNYKTNEILSREDIDFKAFGLKGFGILTYTNPEMEGMYYPKSECDFPPQPAAPTFPELNGTSAKKMAAWQEEINKINEEYKKKLEEWSNQIKQRENFCTLNIYKDKEMTQKLISISKAERGTIVDNNKVLITRANEVALYNLNTGAEVWKTDTNF